MVDRYSRDIHHRQSIRLSHYDYSLPGAYFVTICVKNRESILGDIKNSDTILNDVGLMVQKAWDELDGKYGGIKTDKFIIMPNHIHGIIFLLVGAGSRACPDMRQANSKGHPQGGAPTLSLPDVVHRFKSYTTAQYRIGVERSNWNPFLGKLWQRNYYEHVIRNEKELYAVRRYIQGNPLNWLEDVENPANFRKISPPSKNPS